jgi:SlyX protein
LQYTALVTLDFDGITLDRTPDAAALLQGPGQRLQLLARQRQTPYHSDGLAPPALGLPVQPDDAVTAGGCGAVLPAYTVGDRAVALGAKASGFGGVDEAGAAFVLSLHGRGVSFSMGRRYITCLSLRTVRGRLLQGSRSGMGGRAMTELEEVQRQLAELQSQLAFQEHTVQSLNDALAVQQQEILLLRQQLALLKQRQDEHSAQLDTVHGGGLGQEKPPHY